MNNRHSALASEVKELESILAAIPQENIIERQAFEGRLESANTALRDLPKYEQTITTLLTFRGAPVFGSHGIAADFGSKAAGSFSEAYSAIVAGLNEKLRYMGPIPDKAKNQLLITGTAIGSFGFEFEFPNHNDDLFPDASNAKDAMEKMQALLRVSALGTDDEVTELVDLLHPRAVKKVAAFLFYLSQQQAWCGLEFGGGFFRYKDIDQLKTSADRLQEANIHESEEEFVGELQGILPTARTFELKVLDQEIVIKGKVEISIDDPDILNREWLHKPVRVALNVIQVGQGRPRYTLQNLSSITALESE